MVENGADDARAADEESTAATLDGLFASDLAKDVRSEFNARREDGLSVPDATAAVVEHFRHLLDCSEEGPVVIVAIAVLQLLEHAPTATFRDAALDLLREGFGFASRLGEDVLFRRNRDAMRSNLIDLLENAIVRLDEPI